MPDSNSRLVYSTEGGTIARTPREGRGKTSSQPALGSDPKDGIVRLHRQSKGRGGKVVTVVTGLPSTAGDLDALLKALKTHCGTGGTRDGNTLVIQGDQRERLLAKLQSLGLRVKMVGG